MKYATTIGAELSKYRKAREATKSGLSESRMRRLKKGDSPQEVIEIERTPTPSPSPEMHVTPARKIEPEPILPKAERSVRDKGEEEKLVVKVETIKSKSGVVYEARRVEHKEEPPSSPLPVAPVVPPPVAVVKPEPVEPPPEPDRKQVMRRLPLPAVLPVDEIDSDSDTTEQSPPR